nr:CrcB family protein [uncultured Actinoplanes sp.]
MSRTDPDVDRHVARDRVERRRAWPVPAVISAGGVIGAEARYGLSVAWPHPTDGFAWSTFVTNVSGCLLIGVLMVVIAEVLPRQRLLRPFVGVGILGGYTTFSTYVLDVHQAATAGAATVALIYLAVTLVAALAAVWAGSALTAAVLRGRAPGRRR